MSCKWQKKSISLNFSGWKYDFKRKCWITNAEVRFLMTYGYFFSAMYLVFAGWTATLSLTGIGAIIPLLFGALSAISGSVTWFADKIYEDRCNRRKGIWLRSRIWKKRGWSKRPHTNFSMGCN